LKGVLLAQPTEVVVVEAAEEVVLDLVAVTSGETEAVVEGMAEVAAVDMGGRQRMVVATAVVVAVVASALGTDLR
jgi:hypothetical protein